MKLLRALTRHAAGGAVTPPPAGRDTVPAMLSPAEGDAVPGIVVYVATQETCGEGGMLLGVYSSLRRARSACQVSADETDKGIVTPLEWDEHRGVHTSNTRAFGLYVWCVWEAVVDEALS